jgi:hypothetical protein
MIGTAVKILGHVVHMGDKRNAYTFLVRKPEGNRRLAKHGCRWEDNIKICFKIKRRGSGLGEEREWTRRGEGVDWMRRGSGRDEEREWTG